jgi:hypothetical protein
MIEIRMRNSFLAREGGDREEAGEEEEEENKEEEDDDEKEGKVKQDGSRTRQKNSWKPKSTGRIIPARPMISIARNCNRIWSRLSFRDCVGFLPRSWLDVEVSKFSH